MPLALLLAAALAVPQPGKIETFKDWTVGCDNIRHCTAVALLPEDAAPDASDALRVVIERDGDATAAVTLTMTLDTAIKGAATLAVDGRAVQPLDFAGREFTSLTVSSAALAAMVQGSALTVRIDGKDRAHASLAGLAAALRYSDAQQKRAGGPTALVARGSGAAPPPPPPAPTVTALHPPAGAERTLSAAATAAWRKRFGCDGDIGGPDTSRAWPLAPGKTLVLLACGGGAYNSSEVPLIVTGQAAAVAPFDLRPSWGEDQTMLVNGDWDAKTGRLTSYTKARGLGDCGSAQSFAWDGARFRLVEQTDMGECRGSIDWIRTWTATMR